MLTLFTFLYYYVLRFYDPANPLVSTDGGSHHELKDVERIFLYSVLQAIIISASFLKIMSFLKVDPGFGLLVDSVNQCITDCIPFSTFLCAWMGLFCIVYRILGMGITPGDYGGGKHMLNNVAQYALQTYRNTVGDDAPPDVPYWNVQSNTPVYSKIMIGLVWACWLFNSFLLMLILLNFLIAVLCESFDTVQNEAIQYQYKAKAEMNVDTMLLQKVMGKLNPFEAVILSCKSSSTRSSNPLDKAIEQIKQSQEKVKEDMIKGIQTET